MSERPIPEILGWHPDWPDGHSAYKVWWKDGQRQPLLWQPTPDHMRAWIRSKGGYALIEDVEEGVIIYVHGAVQWPQPGSKYEAAGPFPTLHAALAAAVRAVDEAER